MVTTFFASALLTVCTAFPAKTGRSNVSASITAETSEITITSSSAATRGITFLAAVVAGAQM